MLRRIIFLSLILVTWQLQAETYRCPVDLQDDIFITPKQVSLVGTSGTIIITPEGKIMRNGVMLKSSEAVRQQAKTYQANLRKELPEIYLNIVQRLNVISLSLDDIVSQQLGNESKISHRLKSLKNQLKNQLSRIIQLDGDYVTFHHKMVSQVILDSQGIIAGSLGGILQDSINELGSKKMQLDNLLENILTDINELQQRLEGEWDYQKAELQPLIQQNCNYVIELERQRADLLKSLSS